MAIESNCEFNQLIVNQINYIINLKINKNFMTKKSLCKCCAILVLLLSMGIGVMAQEITVTGTVSDYDGPIPGVNVVVKGTTNGVITDIDGKFSLNVPNANATLQISFVGYITQEIVVNNQRNINVNLIEDSQALEEVVVIGYGSVKRSSVTTAVSKMDAQALGDRPQARVEGALQGQLAGVMVRSVTGEPGADIFIRVRGAASVNASSDPLYVIDGMPINTLRGVNPADIESIEVLKDAAASAIYGSRGSNGVVIVTTKEGKRGQPRVSLNVSYGVQTLEKRLDLLSSKEWMEFRTKANDSKYLRDATARGKTPSIADDNATRRENMGLSGFSFDYDLDPRWFKYLDNNMRTSHPWHTQQGDADDIGLAMLDWQKEWFRPAGVSDISFNISGASDNTSYMFSTGVFSQDGMVPGTDYNRYSFRMNVESKISKYVTVGMRLSPTYITQNGEGRANGKDTRTHIALVSLPVDEVSTGYYFNTRGNPEYAWHFTGSTASSSSLAYMDNITHDDMFRGTGNAYVRITPLDELKIELSGSANLNDTDRQTYIFTENGRTWYEGEGQRSSAGHITSRQWTTVLQALLNYDKQFGMHDVSAMLGASLDQSNVGFRTTQDFSYPFPNDAIHYTFNMTTVPATGNRVEQMTPNRLASFFGRFAYNYDGRYLLSVSLRRDGCSVFGADSKWGMFPAVSAGWNIARENFFSNLNIDWLNTLKLRASYGATGNNAISNTAAYHTLASVTYSGALGYIVTGGLNPGTTVGSTTTVSGSNLKLGWEKTNSTDIALDLGFLQNRIQLSLDWYTKSTSALLYEVPVMGASGLSSQWANAGEISNKGFEIELNTTNLNGVLKWSTSFNLSYNVNMVKQLGEANTPVYNNFNTIVSVRKVGEPLNVFFLPKNIGVWKTQEELDAYARELGVDRITYDGGGVFKPGDPRYEDINKDGNIDFGTGENSDRQIVGNPLPKFTYGMTNRFAYKDFDLSILLTAQTGGHILGLYGRQCDRPGMSVGDNVMGRWRNAYWSPEDPGDGKTPYIFAEAQRGNADTRWLYKSDYLRIKNVTLGYKIPVNPKFISNLRAYVSIENLVKWDYYYNGFSPEAANSVDAAWGLDYSGYPSARTFTFGLNVNF